MQISISELKKEIENELMSAYFSGYGAALVEVSDLEGMNENELLEVAGKLGINVSKYL